MIIPESFALLVTPEFNSKRLSVTTELVALSVVVVPLTVRFPPIVTVVPSSVITLSVTVLESLHFVTYVAVPDPSTNEDPQTRESISSVTIEEPL